MVIFFCFIFRFNHSNGAKINDGTLIGIYHSKLVNSPFLRIALGDAHLISLIRVQTRTGCVCSYTRFVGIKVSKSFIRLGTIFIQFCLIQISPRSVTSLVCININEYSHICWVNIIKKTLNTHCQASWKSFYLSKSHRFQQMYLINNLPEKDDDYTGYHEVAYYRGPIPDIKSRWYEFPLDPPVCGRYFVLQRSAPNDGVNNYLEIAEVELYSSKRFVVFWTFSYFLYWNHERQHWTTTRQLICGNRHY